MRPVAVVTGASRGIGASILERLSQSHDCIVIGRTRPSRCTRFISADLTNSIATEEAATELDYWLRSRGTPPALLVNNAGGAKPATAIDIPPEQLRQDITLNLLAPMLLTRVALRAMKAEGAGAIVNVSSIAGRSGVAHLPAYSAAKAGLIAYTQSVAQEAIHFGVRVNCVCPGAVDTTGAAEGRQQLSRLHGREPNAYQDHMADRTGLGRLIRPEEVAEVVYWLALRTNALNGQTINVCGTLAMG